MGERLWVPTSATEITAEWLSLCLKREVADLSCERIGEAYGFMSEVYRCGFTSSGTTDSVVVKCWSSDGPGGGSEVPFFAFVGDSLKGTIPACYYARSSKDTKRATLILEDLQDASQGDCLETYAFDRSVPLAKLLARVHAQWWHSQELSEQAWLRSLPVVNREDEWFDSRKDLFLNKYSDITSEEVKRLIASPQILQKKLLERLEGFPFTLLHADFHLDNILFRAESGEPVLLDWALVARGPCVLDVAALCFDICDPNSQAEIARKYHRYLSDFGVEINLERFMKAMGGALVFRIMACTLGTARWEPKTDRESKIVQHTLNRLSQAIENWQKFDGELFE